MDAVARDAVRRRAGYRCEYCLLRQVHTEFVHQIEHIVAKQHGGATNWKSRVGMPSL
jgi:5-methylcytosine-specific restriction endonuclease McrA